MFTDLDNTAADLISEFGGMGTYTQSTNGVYANGRMQVVKTDTPVKMVLLDLTLQSNGLSVKYGTQVIAGDKEAYVLPPQKTGSNPITITPGSDTVLFGGVTYTVVTFKEINPTGANPIVYFMYLRR